MPELLPCPFQSAFNVLVDLHDALVMTREHNPHTHVISFVDHAAEFDRATKFLSTRPTTLVTDEVVERDEMVFVELRNIDLKRPSSMFSDDGWYVIEVPRSAIFASMPTVVTGEQPESVGAIPGSHPADQAPSGAPAFTPGPWRRSRKSSPSTYIIAEADGQTVARVTEFVKEYVAEQVANANLIAAAPELYEALEAAELLICLLTGSQSENEEARVVVLQARAARAKARGEQP